MVTTKVTIGELIVPDMPIGVATHMGLSYPLDGFLGLGFMGINSGGLFILFIACLPFNQKASLLLCSLRYSTTKLSR